MKFKATIETAARSYEMEFDLDDETASQARLAEVLGDLTKKFLRKTERTERAAGAGKAGAPTQIIGTGSAK